MIGAFDYIHVGIYTYMMKSKFDPDTNSVKYLKLINIEISNLEKSRKSKFSPEQHNPKPNLYGSYTEGSYDDVGTGLLTGSGVFKLGPQIMLLSRQTSALVWRVWE